MKKHLFLISVAIISVISICLATMVYYPRLLIEKTFREILSEVETLPAICTYGVLYTDGQEVNVSEICIKNDYILNEIICAYNNDLFCICTNNTVPNSWYLIRIYMDTMQLDEIIIFEDVKTDYVLNCSLPYKNRSAFYWNDCIIISDFDKVMVYSLLAGEYQIYQYNNYSFPETVVSGEVIDHTALKVYDRTTEQSFSLETMSKHSMSLSMIYEMKDKTIWNGNPSLSNFFECIQYVDGEMYCLGSLLNYGGETYVIVLQYDFMYNCWNYATMAYSGDYINERCYVVRQIKTERQGRQGTVLREP